MKFSILIFKYYELIKQIAHCINSNQIYFHNYQYPSLLLLEQQEGDTGSASSVIGTLFTILGSVGMSLASLSWGNIVIGLGVIITVFSLMTLVAWNLFMKSKIPCIGVKDIPSTCSSARS